MEHKKFEYVLVDVPNFKKTEEYEAFLNDLGAKGWEATFQDFYSNSDRKNIPFIAFKRAIINNNL